MLKLYFFSDDGCIMRKVGHSNVGIIIYYSQTLIRDALKPTILSIIIIMTLY